MYEEIRRRVLWAVAWRGCVIGGVLRGSSPVGVLSYARGPDRSRAPHRACSLHATGRALPFPYAFAVAVVA
jgi:hypothetical protein